MNPNKWLELVTKHVSDPEAMPDDELAILRSNYVVWKAALTLLRTEAGAELITGTQHILKGQILPDEEFQMLKEGQVKPPSLTEEQWEANLAHKRFNHEWVIKINAARTLVDFYSKFDKEFEVINGAPAPEVTEVYWKTRAENLQYAIQKHRDAHVMANKQPNGYDFLLWMEIGEGEFYASQHLGMQKNGHIQFREI